MSNLSQVECDSGCYKLIQEYEAVDDVLHVHVKNGSLSSTVRSDSVMRGCKEDVNIQFPKKFSNEEVKKDAGKEPVFKAIKFSIFLCNERLCNSALDIVPGLLIFLPFVLVAFNFVTI